MPRFFFHMVAPEGRTHDDLGCELAGIEDAYLNAYQAALDISIEMLRARADPAHHRFEVTDERGQLLFDLPFAEATRPAARHTPASVIHGRLRQQKKRTAKAVAELRSTFERTRSLLAETQALLARAAAR